MKKLIFICITALILITATSVKVGAAELDMQSIYDIIPDGIKDDLQIEQSSDVIDTETFGFDYMMSLVGRTFDDAASSAAVSFGIILGVILISSAASLHFKDTLDGKARDAVSLIGTLTIACTILGHELARCEEIAAFTSSISAFVGAMTPILYTMHTATANTVTAGVTASGFLLFSSAVEFLSTHICIPLYKAALSFSVVSASLPTDGGTRSIAGFLRRTFTTVMTAAAIIYVTVLSYQTHLASAADSVAARSVKFAVSSSVPVVGGILSDTVRTVYSGLSVIKSGSGTLGIVVMIALSLPLLIKLFLSGTLYGIAAFMASLFGCDREASLLTAFRECIGLLCAVISVIVVVFIISTALFIKTAPALLL